MLKLDVGQTGPAGFAGGVLQVKVVGLVASMPTSAAGQQAVLADWEALQAYQLAAAQPPRPAAEWWLAAADTAPAREVLRRSPQWDVTMVDRHGLTATLRDDPLASGLQGALSLGFAAALGFAVLGFLVNAVVTARERRAEFAVLRALGTSSRQVFGLLATEQAFVIGLSLAAGTGLGVVVGNLVVPHIVLTGQASAVTPGVLRLRGSLPWVRQHDGWPQPLPPQPQPPRAVRRGRCGHSGATTSPERRRRLAIRPRPAASASVRPARRQCRSAAQRRSAARCPSQPTDKARYRRS
ncbi:ABC transporter permease [Nonomuraea cavernae]|uniref:ABC transporter permease n=1 Tax=Nonomuraea cavernae TaxID=2045107 RepID=UPI003407B2DD